MTKTRTTSPEDTSTDPLAAALAAQKAIVAYAEETAAERGEDALIGLIRDLGHYATALDLYFPDIAEHALSLWARDEGMTAP